MRIISSNILDCRVQSAQCTVQCVHNLCSLFVVRGDSNNNNRMAFSRIHNVAKRHQPSGCSCFMKCYCLHAYTRPTRRQTEKESDKEGKNARPTRLPVVNIDIVFGIH